MDRGTLRLGAILCLLLAIMPYVSNEFGFGTAAVFYLAAAAIFLALSLRKTGAA